MNGVLRARVLTALLAFFSLVGCTTAGSQAPAKPGGSAAVAVVPRDYGSACAPCHDRGGLGVRVLADRLGSTRSLLHTGTALPPEAIRVIVRRGLGAMPSMSRLEVTDAELANIVEFLGQSLQGQTTP
jgi:mono/diheme cytochrome c family protein